MIIYDHVYSSTDIRIYIYIYIYVHMPIDLQTSTTTTTHWIALPGADDVQLAWQALGGHRSRKMTLMTSIL